MAVADPSRDSDCIDLFLCGDVMTGRGIDQILPYPNAPEIYEPYMDSAVGYVELAESARGPIARPADFAYIWGDALPELERASPDVRIANLETSITRSGDHWRGKGINYRMHPKNMPCIAAARFDCCSLANNHVLDWGYAGLAETLETLHAMKVKSAGAGRNRNEAEAPAIMEVPGKGRVPVFACGTPTSGIPSDWAASEDAAGVNLLTDLSQLTVRRFKRNVLKVKRRGDVTVASIHWGENWGYDIPRDQIQFAHGLIDEAGVDVVHGHSSHHVKGIEVYKEKPIIYGCGDFLNDYEGIGGHEGFRHDLALMYFLHVEVASGKLVSLRMAPMRIEHFRLNRASQEDALWLRDVLNREGSQFRTRVELDEENTLNLKWS